MIEPRHVLATFLASQAFLLPNLSDTFAYACADTEQITVGDGEIMADFWQRHGHWGLVAIAALKRQKLPIAHYKDRSDFNRALDELLAMENIGGDEDNPWTLLDEFEVRFRGDKPKDPRGE